GERRVARQSRALGAERLLDHLDEDVLPFAEQVLDLRLVPVLGLLAARATRVALPRRFARSLGLVVRLTLAGLVRIVHRRGVLGDVRDVEEPVALETDVDEGGLHPGEHLRYAAFVDVADDAALAFALDEELCDEIVF